MSVPILRLTAWQRPVFLVNSRPGRFSAAPHSSPRKEDHRKGHPLSRSYGVRLPSSLTAVLPSTFGYSPRPPVSVSGTGTYETRIEAFLGSMLRVSLCPKGTPHNVSGLWPRAFTRSPPTRLDRDVQHPADLSLLRHPIASLSPRQWYGNIDPFSIAYACRPRLRSRLTLSGLTFLRNPWAFGVQVSRLHYRYSFRHNHFRFVHPTSRSSFTLQRNAPLPDALAGESRASVAGLSPVNFRRGAA